VFLSSELNDTRELMVCVIVQNTTGYNSCFKHMLQWTGTSSCKWTIFVLKTLSVF